jgi:hypothetical protein
MSEAEIIVGDVAGVLHTWFDRDVEDFQFELPSGKMATRLTVTEEGVTFQAIEDFGEGFVPYADSPDKHREYLESEDVAETDGVVEYTLEDGSIELPQTIYFSHQIEFDKPITASSPSKIAERLEEELNAIEGISGEVEVSAPDSL